MPRETGRDVPGLPIGKRLSSRTLGLVLAGGRGTRMGPGPAKPLRELGGRPMLAYAIDRLTPLCSRVLINAPTRTGFDRFGLDVVLDTRKGFAGPLAGLEAGLRHAAETARGPQSPDAFGKQLLVVPADTPFLATGHLEKLIDARASLPAIASFDGYLQPTVGLWPSAILPALTAWLDDERPHAIRAFLAEVGYHPVPIEPYSSAPGSNPFFNVNTARDLDEANRWWAMRPPQREPTGREAER